LSNTVLSRLKPSPVGRKTRRGNGIFWGKGRDQKEGFNKHEKNAQTKENRWSVESGKQRRTLSESVPYLKGEEASNGNQLRIKRKPKEEHSSGGKTWSGETGGDRVKEKKRNKVYHRLEM